eukprot:Awhi_evm1s5946
MDHYDHNECVDSIRDGNTEGGFRSMRLPIARSLSTMPSPNVPARFSPRVRAVRSASFSVGSYSTAKYSLGKISPSTLKVQNHTNNVATAIAFGLSGNDNTICSGSNNNVNSNRYVGRCIYSCGTR